MSGGSPDKMAAPRSTLDGLTSAAGAAPDPNSPSFLINITSNRPPPQNVPCTGRGSVTARRPPPAARPTRARPRNTLQDRYKPEHVCTLLLLRVGRPHTTGTLRIASRSPVYPTAFRSMPA
ncbi:hypothetical protein EVAR_53255_1 [Eumeta japonica]|uniref:Uncharacterized protein n=1 Tax=Eumeta variegata TaxID=151549 RepID=A0A4C1YJJ5_EUMVA|nr:hypothetical protein EVAR_53255_1 [Eumeta japonica]